mmetsp:Transcript_27869/g.52025  ORF Transcript_27869/g.52025 Transcript_27869/m.52025 type:complete len:95 (-) Transcript_27869:187-471(-)
MDMPSVQGNLLMRLVHATAREDISNRLRARGSPTVSRESPGASGRARLLVFLFLACQDKLVFGETRRSVLTRTKVGAAARTRGVVGGREAGLWA